MSPTYIENPKVQYRVAGGWVNALTGDTTPVPGFPTVSSVGVEAAAPGWEPVTVIEDQPGGFIEIGEEGAVVEDFRFIDTTVIARAPHITFRRCEFVSNTLNNHVGGPTLYNGMVVEDCTFRNEPNGVTTGGVGNAAVSVAGMTLRRCLFNRVTEGIRTGGTTWALADGDDPLGYTVRIYDCYVGITGPDPCIGIDYHGDCVQSSDTGLPGGGTPLRIRRCHFDSLDRDKDPDADPPEVSPLCGGNSCITTAFGHSQPWDIDGLILSGSGIGMYLRSGGDIRNTYFVDDSFVFGPLTASDDDWELVTTWQGYGCTLDGAGQVDEITGTIPFGYPGFGPYDPPP